MPVAFQGPPRAPAHFPSSDAHPHPSTAHIHPALPGPGPGCFHRMGALAFFSITRVLTAGALPLALCEAWISSFQTLALTLESVLPFCCFSVSVSRRLFVDAVPNHQCPAGRMDGSWGSTVGSHPLQAVVSVLKFTESGHNPSARRQMMEKQNAVCM